ncbi:MAG: hypothetical protein AB7F41_04835 [Methylocystis sp.]|uniref:hypothetical protein n=1 Tax=Methylocystis sp. TaxID=1911079 RepID=UPI003D145DB0
MQPHEANSFQQEYRYAFASHVVEGATPALALAATNRTSKEELFFSGALSRADLAAALLLATSEVALQRYFTPKGEVVRRLRGADPVVSAGGGRLRFEAFSRCCGVYARADFLPGMLAPEVFVKGVTNVDFNPDTRAALAGMRAGEAMALRVSPDAVEISSSRETAVERKVVLPLRWLKGFAEVQALATRLEMAMTLDGSQARRFLSSLPNAVGARDHVWLSPAPGGPRLSQRAGDGAVASAGLGRLSAMKPLARFARGLRIYAGAFGTSAFELDFDVARFLVVLSATPARGFSGEGQLLAALASGGGEATMDRIAKALSDEDDVSLDALAQHARLPATDVVTTLSLLAAQGVAGYDPRERRFFHRELPFDRSSIESLHPRLRDARKLVEVGAVSTDVSSGTNVTARVTGGDVEHRTRLDGAEFHCTCAWHSRTLGESGPCKHVLATLLATKRNVA